MTSVITPDTADDNPPRAGRPWFADEEKYLVDMLRAGLDLESIAEDLERSEGALTSRMKRMIDPGVSTANGVESKLRRLLLEDPTYDWQSRLEANLPGRRDALELREILQQHWAQRTPIAEIVKETGKVELYLFNAFVRHRIALNHAEVKERLGADPDGRAAMGLAIAANPSNTKLWCMVLTTSRGVVRHCSLHHRADAARAAGAAVLEKTSEELHQTLTHTSLFGGGTARMEHTPWQGKPTLVRDGVELAPYEADQRLNDATPPEPSSSDVPSPRGWQALRRLLSRTPSQPGAPR